MWSDFEKLRRIWAARREGSGGVSALAGFSFQLLAALAELVCRPSQTRQPSVFLEALSDFVSADGGYLIVTQAKLSLRSSSLKAALDELWQIHQLAQAETSELEPHLRYAILSSRNLLRDVEAAVSRWEPQGDADPDAISAFTGRIQVKVETDPRLTLAVHLVNALGDAEPFRRVDNWMGHLLVDPTTAGLESSIRDITLELSALEAAAREREHKFYIWQSTDRPPAQTRFEADPDKATLAGQTPSHIHLGEGRFARRWFYDDVMRQCEEWLSHGQSEDGRLSVFWIAGRSGTGKSVALLHLLSDLQQQGEQRIIVWLHQQADRLSEAIRWARPFFADGRQVLVAADDPYTPERHQRVAAAINDSLRELDSLRIAHPEAQRPSVIFCGPTEQGYLFEDDLADFVAIEPHILRREGERDIAELRKWYTERTGLTDLPVGDADNILIVQLFFEWLTGGPIREFSQRFRRRLEGMKSRDRNRSLFEIVAEVLALNRLYSLFPASALDEELERDPPLGAAFDQLRHDERHLVFDSERGGYRLTHPHLANAIYTTWFGRNEHRRHRKEHLRVGIEAALDHSDSPSQRFAPLWAISRLSRDQTRAVEGAAQRLELVEAELREVLADIYVRRFADAEKPLVELPVWVNLNRWFGLALSPNPISLLAASVETADADAAGLRLSCHTLLGNRSDFSDAAPIVARVLAAHRNWFEWHHVASHYVTAVGPAGISTVLQDYVSEQWMLSSTRTLLGSCLRSADQEEAEAVVLRWLEIAPEIDPAWPGIYTALFDRTGLTDTLERFGEQFLAEMPDHPSWSHVWERLYRHADDPTRLATKGKSWLAVADAAISGWDRVWEALWGASRGSDDELRERGRAWLDEVFSDHHSWAYVWEALWDVSGRPDAELRERGRQWLDEASPNHASWAYIWRALWDASRGSDDELRERGRAWLDEVFSDHRSWAYVWEALWDVSGRSDDELRERGRQWLDEASPDHASWSYVWKALWDASPGSRDELRERGRRWLDEVSPEHASWSHVWNVLWDTSCQSDDNLRQRAGRWLDEVSPDHPSWQYVWEPLWEAAGRSDEDLRQRGRRWLDDVFSDHHSWRYVWHALWDPPRRSDDELRERGRRWLEEASPDHPSWGFVWQTLWKSSPQPDEELRQRGRRWLEEASTDHPSWGLVWQTLWKSPPQPDEELRQRGLRWLEEASLDHPSWGFVWQVLWEASDRPDEDLRQRGLRWLNDASAQNGSWAYVWRSVRRNAPQERSDLDLKGVWWLEQSGTGSRAWPIVWQVLWNETKIDTQRLRDIAQTLLVRIPPRSPERIGKMLESPRPDFNPDDFGGATGHERGRWSWKERWSGEWRDAAGDNDRLAVLAREAEVWLSKFDFGQGGWTSVWTDIFHATEDPEKRRQLLALAAQWYVLVGPSHPRREEIRRLLDTNSESGGRR